MTEPHSTTPQAPNTTPPSPGVFGTRIPSTVTFAVGILLFFTPFLEIKCNSMTIQSVSGVQLATGFKVDTNKGAAGYFSDMSNSLENKTDRKVDREDPNIYAMLALLFAILGLIVAIVKMRPKVNSIAGMIMALATSISLILLWSDIGNRIKLQVPKSEDGLSISIGMTSWFYVTVIVFLAAAFFNYKRLKSEKTP
jgi:hypothetical protein